MILSKTRMRLGQAWVFTIIVQWVDIFSEWKDSNDTQWVPTLPTCILGIEKNCITQNSYKWDD